MKKEQKDSAIVCGILSIFLIYIGLKIGEGASGDNVITAVLEGINKLWDSIVAGPLNFVITGTGLVCAFGLLACLWLAWLYMFYMPKPQRVGEEHGSSRWATIKEMLMFKNKEQPDNNLVFSKNSGMATKKKKFDLKTDRNLNVAIIGGSGSGKTRYYVKPNLMQLHGNYFVTDPKGTVVEECGHLMRDNGYEVKCFNVIPDTMNQSLCYNPLYYIKSKEQILAFVNCLIKNTTPDKKSSGDPFWEKSETLLYVAVLSLMQDWLPRSDFCLPDLVYWLEFAQAKEEDEDWQSPLDLLFQQVEKGCQYVSVEPNGYDDNGNPEWAEGLEWWCDITGQQLGGIEENAKEVNGFSVVSNKKQVQGIGILEPRPNMIDIPSLLTNNNSGKNFREMYEEICGDKKGNDIAKQEFIKLGQEQDWENEFCVSKYNEFKTAAGKTLKSIIISCNVRLMPITIPQVKEILSGIKRIEDGEEVAGCEMDLDKLGDPDKKMTIFAVMSDTNDTYFFLVAIMMYQVMDLLCNVALTKYKGKLPTFVHFIFDEFANLGVLADFDRTIAITRSRNIGVSLILQTPFQLEGNYTKEKAKVIIDNCDTMVYLGGGSDGADASTCKEISARLGKETIHTRTYNQTKGKQGSTSQNNAIQARELLMPDEVARLSRDEELVLIKNTFPFKDKKFVLEEHKRYDYIDPESHIGNNSKHSSNFDYLEYKKLIREVVDKYGEDYENNPAYWKEYYKTRKDLIETKNKINNKNYEELLKEKGSNRTQGKVPLSNDTFEYNNKKELEQKLTSLETSIKQGNKDYKELELAEISTKLKFYEDAGMQQEYNTLLEACEQCNYTKSLEQMEQEIFQAKRQAKQKQKKHIQRNNFAKKHSERVADDITNIWKTNIEENKQNATIEQYRSPGVDVPKTNIKNNNTSIGNIRDNNYIAPAIDLQLDRQGRPHHHKKKPGVACTIDYDYYFNDQTHICNFLNYLFAANETQYNRHYKPENYFFIQDKQIQMPNNKQEYLKVASNYSNTLANYCSNTDINLVNSCILYLNYAKNSKSVRLIKSFLDGLPSQLLTLIKNENIPIRQFVIAGHINQKDKNNRSSTPHIHFFYIKKENLENIIEEPIARVAASFGIDVNFRN